MNHAVTPTDALELNQHLREQPQTELGWDDLQHLQWYWFGKEGGNNIFCFEEDGDNSQLRGVRTPYRREGFERQVKKYGWRLVGPIPNPFERRSSLDPGGC